MTWQKWSNGNKNSYSVITMLFESKPSRTNRVDTWSGNQEKSRKNKKNDKSQEKMGIFEKRQEIFFKSSNFVSSNLPNS